MVQNCICFTTDAGYLFPTLVAAIQARAHSSRELADVAVYCIGPESAETETFAEVCAEEKLQFACLKPPQLENAIVNLGGPGGFAISSQSNTLTGLLPGVATGLIANDVTLAILKVTPLVTSYWRNGLT